LRSPAKVKKEEEARRAMIVLKELKKVQFTLAKLMEGVPEETGDKWL